MAYSLTFAFVQSGVWERGDRAGVKWNNVQ
jgi:hypothetical protein